MSSMPSVARNVVTLVLILFIVGLAILIVNYLYNTNAPPVSAAHFVVQKRPGVVYKANFDADRSGPEWSSRTVSRTKNGQHKFLGPFRELPLAFTVDGLPVHQFIHVTFDLITFEPWNGDSANWGRDLWDMRVEGGQPLIHTTFSNCGFFNDNNEQSFPDQYPWYPAHPGWTGAAAKQSLGWTNSWGGESYATDSTYAFDLYFPHTADTLRLRFQSQIKQHDNKPYGFLNFKVETIDQPTHATDDALGVWWNDLGGEDPLRAYHAAWSLIATADAATAYIHPRLPPPDPSIPLNIDQQKLWQHGSFQYDTPQQRQRARALHVLEVIHSPASIKILKDIGFAGTPQGAPPTRWGP